MRWRRAGDNEKKRHGKTRRERPVKNKNEKRRAEKLRGVNLRREVTTMVDIGDLKKKGKEVVGDVEKKKKEIEGEVIKQKKIAEGEEEKRRRQEEVDTD